MRTEFPLVSAIMPTRGRREWAAQALAMLEAQDYPAKEIVIVDELAEPSFAEPPSGAVYVYKSGTIGTKRNVACANARGEIIIHWDSDDIYATNRISSQVEQLIDSGADLVGYNSMPFVEADGEMRRGTFTGIPTYILGVSFCYWKRFWQERPFLAEAHIGEDNEFRRKREDRCKVFPCDGLITMRVHCGNTSDKKGPLARDKASWRIAA